jgi:SAM-dependent methyltransferase
MTHGDWFGSGVDAARYARSRPRIHAAVVGMIGEFAAGAVPFTRALDVGAGTGHSTVALTAIAESVVGVDSSAAMLAHALAHDRVRYECAPAENLPFAEASFDLVTAGLAFHWFDSGAFLEEAGRVLTGSGWLVLYNSWFTGEMREEAAFRDWFRDDFLQRYPSPPRAPASVSPDQARAHALAVVGSQSLETAVEMTLDQFIDYELSTTNIIHAVREGEPIEDAQSWLQAAVARAGQGRTGGTFLFAGRIDYLRPAAG